MRSGTVRFGVVVIVVVVFALVWHQELPCILTTSVMSGGLCITKSKTIGAVTSPKPNLITPNLIVSRHNVSCQINCLSTSSAVRLQLYLLESPTAARVEEIVMALSLPPSRHTMKGGGGGF